jgi:multidrug resistance protein
MSKEKIIIIVTILIDVLGIGIIIPLLPFYVAEFNGSPLAVTSLTAIYALCSFVSAPFLGALSDKIGRRPVLLISLFSSAVGWLVFASAQSLWLLYLAKVIDGLAAGNYGAAQSALSDVARDSKERSANLGLAGALFGMGLIIGPALAGVLALVSHRFPFYFVSILATVNLIATYFLFPETNQHLDKDKEVSPHPFKPIVKAWRDLPLRPVYLISLLLMLGAGSMQSVFALFLGAERGMDVHGVAVTMMLVGLLIAVNQGWLLKNFWLKYFSEPALRAWSMIAFTLSLLLLPLGQHWQLWSVLLLLIFSQSIAGITVTSQAVALGGERRRGEVIGTISSLQSLAMIGAPLLAGAAFKVYAGAAFWLAAAFAALAASLEIGWFRKSRPLENDRLG